MASASPAIFDCDGHIIESIPEMAEFMDPVIKPLATNPSRNRMGVFPGLDGMHYPRDNEALADVEQETREYVVASDFRKGSGEDIAAFQDKAGIETSVLFTSEGLSVGFIQQSDYAVRVCRAFNDYVADRYARVSSRLRPMGLIPMSDPSAAALELRRLVKELGLPGAMLPSTGLSLHHGHEFYWPVYKEAAELGCALGIHGGSSVGFGADSYTSAWAARAVRHPVPLLLALTSMIYHGVLDRFPDFHIGFFEGGAAWPAVLLDRMVRDDSVYVGGGSGRALRDYFSSGQVLIGCEGNEEILSYLSARVGIEAFAFASDYPHEVDVVAARNMIDETLQRSDLSAEEKEAVLGGNAKRFYRL